MGYRRDLALLRGGSTATRLLPIRLLGRLAHRVGRLIAPRLGGTAALERNLRVVGTNDPAKAARRGIGGYASYWVDTLRLPSLPDRVTDRRFSFIGYHHILDVQRAGKTPIMVLPHLGSWEWAAAWLGRIGDQKVVAVVERLEPEQVFEWFEQTRESYGVEVVPLGTDAMRRLVAIATDRSAIICLVADRDIAGNGQTVSFFGQEASLPGGPALLSLRTGSPLLPVAIYDTGSTRECVVCPPLWPERQGKLRDDVARMTQDVARALEPLIAAAPDQWHVLSDIWPAEAS